MALWPAATLLGTRALLEFPAGDNDSDTVLAGVHFNLTTLRHWNYTLYSNDTLSNGSNCYLTFPPYQPGQLLSNGTFLNETWCWSAIEPIGTRGFTGIGFAALYGLGLVLTLTTLAKHGARFLPVERRFYSIGRRWQWYWSGITCDFALVSLFANIDIDRYYIQELPIVVTIFFWFLLCQTTLALVWEAVRHWGSWQQRQFIDPNPFVYRDDDRRATVEFWLPIWFYFWVWMNFFLVVPRNWAFAEHQRSLNQTQEEAIPTATGCRFKAGAFCLLIAWLTIVFSLRHSIQHYKARNRGLLNRAVGFVRAAPLRFVAMLPLSLSMIAYQALISFKWELSVIRYDGLVPVIFAWGYGPTLLIIYTQIAYGFASPNEDKELIRQRRVRGEQVNRELGIVRKPAWWRRVRGDHLASLRDKIRSNVNEVGGGRGIGRRVEDDMERHVRQEAERSAVRDLSATRGIELRNVEARPSTAAPPSYTGRSDRRRAEHVMQSAADMLFPSDNPGVGRPLAVQAKVDTTLPPPYTDGSDTRERQTAERSYSSSTTHSAAEPPQKVWSMLDV